MMTINEVARLAGVSSRTLRYYDQIGLLVPDSCEKNGRRLYDHAALIRLQQILFYRTLGMELAGIKRIMLEPGFNVLDALKAHKSAIQAKQKQLQVLHATLENTIRHLERQDHMDDHDLFRGLSPAEEAAYSAEAATRWDAATVQASQKRWNSMGAADKQAILEEGRQVYRDWAVVMDSGADSPQAMAMVERWRNHIRHFWEPSDNALEGLARLYGEDPRFLANIDGVRPGLAEFIAKAVAVWCIRNGADCP